MAYGIEIRNASGDIVIDDVYPTLSMQLLETRTGTLVSTGLYSYNIPANAFHFANLAVNDYLITHQNGLFYSNKSSIQFRNGSITADLPAPSSYGVAVYNAAGQLCYSAGSDLIVVKGAYSVNSGAVVTCPDPWICITGFKVFHYYNPSGGPPTGVTVATGVKRTSTTQYSYWGVGIAAFAPANYDSGQPVRFMSAA